MEIRPEEFPLGREKVRSEQKSPSWAEIEISPKSEEPLLGRKRLRSE